MQKNPNEQDALICTLPNLKARVPWLPILYVPILHQFHLRNYGVSTTCYLALAVVGKEQPLGPLATPRLTLI